MLETVSVVRVCKVRISLFIVKTEVESNLSWVPENSYKNITRHVGNQILKFLSPTDKNYSHLRVVICNPVLHTCQLFKISMGENLLNLKFATFCRDA